MQFLSLLVWIRRALGVAAILAVVAIAIGWPTNLIQKLAFPTASAAEPQPPLAPVLGDEGRLPDLDGAVAWLNSLP